MERTTQNKELKQDVTELQLEIRSLLKKKKKKKLKHQVEELKRTKEIHRVMSRSRLLPR